MKRALLFGIIFLTIDQLLKLYFQLFFQDKTMYLFNQWGFTYVTNLSYG